MSLLYGVNGNILNHSLFAMVIHVIINQTNSASLNIGVHYILEL